MIISCAEGKGVGDAHGNRFQSLQSSAQGLISGARHTTSQKPTPISARNVNPAAIRMRCEAPEADMLRGSILQGQIVQAAGGAAGHPAHAVAREIRRMPAIRNDQAGRGDRPLSYEATGVANSAQKSEPHPRMANGKTA